MVALILIGIGAILSLVGGIWIIVLAFQESIAWGICSLLCGIVGIVFAIMHWNKCAKPFMIWAAGAVLLTIGQFMAGAEMMNNPEFQRQMQQIQQKK